MKKMLRALWGVLACHPGITAFDHDGLAAIEAL
jgi:hypothetical protein